MTETVRITCPNCKSVLRINKSTTAKADHCPACNQLIQFDKVPKEQLNKPESNYQAYAAQGPADTPRRAPFTPLLIVVCCLLGVVIVMGSLVLRQTHSASTPTDVSDESPVVQNNEERQSTELILQLREELREEEQKHEELVLQLTQLESQHHLLNNEIIELVGTSH